MMKKFPEISKKRKLIWGGALALVVVACGMYAATYFSSSMLLSPSFKGLGGDYATCTEEMTKHFGKSCGNLRNSKEFEFNDVKIPSQNGYDMPGWLIEAKNNGKTPSNGVIMLVHAGGSDRRESTRHVDMYLDQGLDVLTFDQGCAGEAPCPVPGTSYGQRESRDVFSAYLYLTQRYEKVYAMGSSVGASAILIALPEMPKLAGIIAENPYANFKRLIKEAPESKNVPGWATNNMIGMAMSRGKFDALLSPEHSIPLSKTTPIFFIHSKADKVANYHQTKDLEALYDGPKTSWYPERGEHALVSNAQGTVYTQQIGKFLETTR